MASDDQIVVSLLEDLSLAHSASSRHSHRCLSVCVCVLVCVCVSVVLVTGSRVGSSASDLRSQVFGLGSEGSESLGALVL